MSLLDTSKKLRNDSLASAYREATVSVRRIAIVALAIAWALGWKHFSKNAFMATEAARVEPALYVLLIISAAWSYYIRNIGPKNRSWPDVAGAFADTLGIGVILYFGWDVMLFFVTLLPLTSISVGARFSRRELWISICGSILILFFSAPHGYWATRPVVGILAMTIIVGLPLTVYRVLFTIQQISKEAIEARETQNRFFAMMSHELRTPLNTVINATALLEPSTLPPEQRDLVSLIAESAESLLSRINDVLDVAAIKADQMLPVNAAFNLSECLNSIESMFRSAADRKGLSFGIDTEQSMDWPDVVGDRRRIHQVLSNIVGNAIKYTESGGSVRISASGWIQDTDLHVAIHVVDTGVGIPEFQRAQVFEPFIQTTAGRARATEGVGLGLYIAKSISDRLGGKITINDSPGHGTTFAWELQLPIASTEQVEKIHSDLDTVLESHRASTPPICALVIDDNAANRKIMTKILQRAGHSVHSTDSGESGIEMLARTVFDIAFLDMHMPGMAGDEVLRAIKLRFGERSHPPVIIVSADASVDARDLAQSAGAAGYILKPIAIEAVLASIEALAPQLAISQPTQ